LAKTERLETIRQKAGGLAISGGCWMSEGKATNARQRLPSKGPEKPFGFIEIFLTEMRRSIDSESLAEKP
jgi:hypothetical protein